MEQDKFPSILVKNYDPNIGWKSETGTVNFKPLPVYKTATAVLCATETFIDLKICKKINSVGTRVTRKDS